MSMDALALRAEDCALTDMLCNPFSSVIIQPWPPHVGSCQSFHPEMTVMFFVQFIQKTWIHGSIEEYPFSSVPAVQASIDHLSHGVVVHLMCTISTLKGVGPSLMFRWCESYQVDWHVMYFISKFSNKYSLPSQSLLPQGIAPLLFVVS